MKIDIAKGNLTTEEARALATEHLYRLLDTLEKRTLNGEHITAEEKALAFRSYESKFYAITKGQVSQTELEDLAKQETVIRKKK